MGTSIYSIGVSGLNAAQAGLVTTGHNISNATTPGFNRQQNIQSTNTPQFTGAGFIGQGTNVQTIQRVYSQYLSNQVTTSQTRLSELDTYGAEISQLDNMLGDINAGVSSALNDFNASLNAVTANPASIPVRQDMLSSAQALVGRFQNVDARFREIRDGINSQLQSTVSTINSYATQISELNQRIVLAQANGPTQPANDLLDQRDQLIAELNKQVRATTVPQSDGTYNIFIGNGQPLVVGTRSFSLTALPSREDASRFTIGNSLPGGGGSALPEAQLTGGVLGGLLSFRDGSLDAAQNALGRVATALAMSFNDQHRLGQDMSGVLGGAFFVAPTPQTIYPNTPSNAGTAVVSAAISSVGGLTTSDYRLTANGGGNFTLMRLSDKVNVFSGATLPQTVDGLTITLASGAEVAGDTFLIQPTRNGAHDIRVAITDPRSIAAAAPMRSSASLSNTGSGSISAGSVNPPAPPDLNLTQTVSITFNSPPTTFNVVGTGTGNPLGVAYSAGGNITYNGWTLQVSGAPNAGDVFTVSASPAGVSDNRNALKLTGLQTTGIVAGGSATFQGAYSQIVREVGNKTREIQVTTTAQASILKQAQDAQQSLSGVNLDEEAANLLRYQQSFQASGKMIEIASKLFDTLLSLG